MAIFRYEKHRVILRKYQYKVFDQMRMRAEVQQAGVLVFHLFIIFLNVL